MESVCWNEASSKRTVCCWLANFSSGVETSIKGVSTGWPATWHITANVADMPGLIMANRSITFNEKHEETGLTRGTLEAIVRNDMEMMKVRLQCASYTFTPRKKAKRVNICKELLTLHDVDPDDFFSRLLMGNESRLLHDTRGKRCSSMEWNHTWSPHPKKPRPSLKTNKQLAMVFWEVQDIPLVDWLSLVALSTATDTVIARMMRLRIQQRQSGKWAGHVLLQHVTPASQLYTSRCLTRTLTPAGTSAPLLWRWALLCYHILRTPRSGLLAHVLFEKMKDALRSQRVESCAELHAIVRMWRTNNLTESFIKALQDLPDKSQKCIDLAVDYNKLVSSFMLITGIPPSDSICVINFCTI